VCAFLASGPAAAATIEVTTLQDNAAAGECELDEAITNANQDTQNFGCDTGDGADLIVFDGNLDGTLVLDGALPTITETLTIRGRGPDRIRISGGGLFQPLAVAPGVSLTLESIQIREGAAPNGGALAIQNGADVVLRECRIAANDAANGAGIDLDRGTLRIERCLLDGNVASGDGGALRNRGGEVHVVNSTFSNNAADQGGAILVQDNAGPGLVELRSVTFAGNEASDGSGVFVGGSSEVAAQHTLFAQPQESGHCAGPLTSLDWNLSDDASCDLTGDHDLDDVAAGLAALADNGGPTGTHRLQPGSAAIDAGDLACRDVDGSELLVDQRGEGFPRRRDGDGLPGSFCDLGAYEVPEPGAAAGAAAAGLALAALARRARHRVP
jgi:hypothetical protein